MESVYVTVTDENGKAHRLEGLRGWRLMEVIRDNGLHMPAACDGACACATCHVYVKHEWFTRLIPASADEAMMLEDAMAPESTSRLSCQILLSPELEGLEVTLAPNP